MITAQIYTTAKRLEYIIASNIKYTLIDDPNKIIGNDKQVRIEITLEQGSDIMDLFHAGIEYGMDTIIEAHKVHRI
jgi:hypothetical protein